MKISFLTRFWYWVYRWSTRLSNYSENIADSRYAKEVNKNITEDNQC